MAATADNEMRSDHMDHQQRTHAACQAWSLWKTCSCFSTNPELLPGCPTSPPVLLRFPDAPRIEKALKWLDKIEEEKSDLSLALVSCPDYRARVPVGCIQSQLLRREIKAKPRPRFCSPVDEEAQRWTTKWKKREREIKKKETAGMYLLPALSSLYGLIGKDD